MTFGSYWFGDHRPIRSRCLLLDFILILLAMKKYFIILLALLSTQTTKAQSPEWCDSVCVLDIYIDEFTPPGNITVLVENSSTNFINYPTLIVIDNGTNDTIADDELVFELFGQAGMSTVEHYVTSTLTEIPDNLFATVLFSDNIWDETCELTFPCDSVADTISQPVHDLNSIGSIKIYPLPSTEIIFVNP